MKTVLITGGTGLVGKHLSRMLAEAGYSVVLLSRNKDTNSEYKVLSWDPAKGEIDNAALRSADYIIHLAGASIGAKRWSSSRKKLIIASRVQGAELLQSRLSEVDHNVKAFVSASAIGYYG